MKSSIGQNPVRAALVGLAVIAVAVVGSFRIADLPLIGTGGETLSAEFSDASGLKVGDRVQIAGVDVGAITDLEMGRARIIATFRVDSVARLGKDTGAAIRVGNLLGTKFIQILPKGPGTLAGSEPIPLSRTEPAYDVVSAFGDLTETVEPINEADVEEALVSVADTFRGSSADVRAAVRGLSGLSRSVASRNAEVEQLLARSETLTGSLQGSRADIGSLVRDASRLLAEIDRRRDTLRSLIVHTEELSEQLHGLVKDNEKQAGPALKNLARVTALLEGRQAQLGKTVHNLAAFAKVFVNTIGSGPWFDSYIANVPDQAKVGGQP